jgi:hypothetical protein
MNRMLPYTEFESSVPPLPDPDEISNDFVYVFHSQVYPTDLSNAAEWKGGDLWKPFDHPNDGFKHFHSTLRQWRKKISIRGCEFEGHSHTLVVLVLYLSTPQDNASSPCANPELVKGICKVSGPSFYIYRLTS